MDPARGAGTARERGLGGGCGLVLALLVLVLVGGFLALDRGVDWLVERAVERARAKLPAELGEARRTAVGERLDRFVARLPRAGDRDRLTGEFLGRVGAALDDRRLTVEEIEELDRWLADVLGEAAVATTPGPARGGSP